MVQPSRQPFHPGIFKITSSEKQLILNHRIVANSLAKSDYKKIVKIVKNYLEKAGDNEGISFYVEEISLYGSILSGKKKPNDIDIFVYITEVEDLSEETDDEETLAEYLHIFLHGNKQPKYKNLPLDINVKTYPNDFEHIVID